MGGSGYFICLNRGFYHGFNNHLVCAFSLVMVFLSSLDIRLAYQILIFLGIAAVLLIFTRPIAIKKLKAGKAKTNVDSIVGKNALVTKEISEFEKGEVKIHGVIWSALSEDSSVIKEGSRCVIVRIEGVQVIERPISDAANAES